MNNNLQVPMQRILHSPAFNKLNVAAGKVRGIGRADDGHFIPLLSQDDLLGAGIIGSSFLNCFEAVLDINTNLITPTGHAYEQDPNFETSGIDTVIDEDGNSQKVVTGIRVNKGLDAKSRKATKLHTFKPGMEGRSIVVPGADAEDYELAGKPNHQIVE